MVLNHVFAVSSDYWIMVAFGNVLMSVIVLVLLLNLWKKK